MFMNDLILLEHVCLVKEQLYFSQLAYRLLAKALATKAAACPV